MSDKVAFRATFPPIQSAIKVGDAGMRIQLDIPETEMGSAVELLAMRNVVLKVTVEVEKPEEQPETESKKRLTRFVR